MGRLERFLRLEQPRPDRKEAPASGTLDRFREPAPAAEKPAEKPPPAPAPPPALEPPRRERAAAPGPLPPPAPGLPPAYEPLPPMSFEGASPLLWILRALRVIEDPWLRFAARAALIGAFAGLALYAMSSPTRFPLFILLLLLLGGGGLRRRRRRDWWR